MRSLWRSLLQWAKNHHPGWVDAVRVVTGVIIHLKALLFAQGTAFIVRTLEMYDHAPAAKVLVYSIGVVNLVGGTLIMIGLQTRINCLIQIPFVIASVLFSLRHNEGWFLLSNLSLSILIFFLLLFFIVEGSGRFSVDQYIGNSYKTLNPSSGNNNAGQG